MRERQQRPGGTEKPVRVALGALRIALAAAEVLALLANFQYTLSFASFSTANFFWYFTIQSALLTVPVIAVSGALALLGRPEPLPLAVLQALVITYTLLSGIVFGIIAWVSNASGVLLEVPWSDTVLHFVVPFLLLVIWLVDRLAGPPVPPLPWATLAWSIPWPLLWLVLTLVRGQSTGWYPYFFLNSDDVGIGTTAGYCVLVLVLILGFTSALVGISRVRRVPATTGAATDAVAAAPAVTPARGVPAQQSG